MTKIVKTTLIKIPKTACNIYVCCQHITSVKYVFLSVPEASDVQSRDKIKIFKMGKYKVVENAFINNLKTKKDPEKCILFFW
jgi:hypothetical protein